MQAIKNDKKITMPVIIISSEFAIAKIAHDCGAEGYVSKTFDIDNLYQLLSLYINPD